jgi:hypothetical protein
MNEFDFSVMPPNQRDHWSIALFGSWIGRLSWIVAGFAVVSAVNVVCPGWPTFIVFAVWALPLLIASVANTIASFAIAMLSSTSQSASYGRILHLSLTSAIEETFTAGAIVLLATWVF